MTVWNPVITPVGNTSLQGWQIQWGPMLNGDTANPVASSIAAALSFAGGVFDPTGFADRSVQVTGTFGSGGNLAWEGSNDLVNYYVLNNPQGSALNIGSAGISAVTEAVIGAKPVVTAGDVTTSLTVTAFFRRTFQQQTMPS